MPTIKKTRSKGKSNAPTPTKVEVGTATLSMLEAVHAEPLKVMVFNQGTPLNIVGRLLTPREMEPVRAWLDKAQPKVIGDPPKYDLEEPDYPGGYPARKEKCRRMARALALWSAFPMFREAASASTQAQQATRVNDQEGILEFVESRQMPDDLLDELFTALTRDRVKASVGFL